MNKKTIAQLEQIYAALDTLHLQGYQNTKTFSNCLDALSFIIGENEVAEDEVKDGDSL